MVEGRSSETRDTAQRAVMRMHRHLHDLVCSPAVLRRKRADVPRQRGLASKDSIALATYVSTGSWNTDGSSAKWRSKQSHRARVLPRTTTSASPRQGPAGRRRQPVVSGITALHRAREVAPDTSSPHCSHRGAGAWPSCAKQLLCAAPSPPIFYLPRLVSHRRQQAIHRSPQGSCVANVGHVNAIRYKASLRRLGEVQSFTSVGNGLPGCSEDSEPKKLRSCAASE